MKLELGCGIQPSPGFIHHDKKAHSPHIDLAHDLEVLSWPWVDGECDEVLAVDGFEHLHLMPEIWLRECHRILCPEGILQLPVPIYGSPWHVIDPTHVRGFHPLNFDYFVQGRELYQKYGHYYFDFSFRDAQVKVEGFKIVAALVK